MIEFTKEDKAQLEEKSITEKKIQEQIVTFKEGIPFVTLEKAAIIGDGISKFSKDEEQQFINIYEGKAATLALLKFIPASGAASRMFKALFNFLTAYIPKEESLAAYIARTNDKDIEKFSQGLEDFPFYTDVKSRIPENLETVGEELHAIVSKLLSENALNYGFYPKGLLPFHKYKTITATAFKEHLREGALYAATNGVAKLHFTISEQHETMFNFELNEIRATISEETNTNFEVSYSFQKSATDTIAVTKNNEPFRNEDGSILFRPGGHGALIENLNDQNADVIFVKNIDNVVVLNNIDAVARSKKILAGVLLKAQETVFSYQKSIEESPTETSLLVKIKTFLEKELNVRFTADYSALSDTEKLKAVKEKLFRPIRICGMVKNEGEPGGGPFWILDANKATSLQIIESAQIDMSNQEQVTILKDATHFNPVDLVCGVRNYKGEKYDLLNYVDPKQGFITGKTKDGKELKALELPGLWNGAMAYWNTIFVEVPLVTFNPVKSVNDLLKPSHQA